MKILRVMRVESWYKNLLIFLPLVFGMQLGNGQAWIYTLAGFFSLCFASSGGYILNDVLDRNLDRHNPFKRKNPISAGQLSPWFAGFYGILLLALAVVIGYVISLQFLLFVAGLIAFTFLYTIILKYVLFADILIISINFVLRAASGAFVLLESGKPYVWISPWLIICVFFLALFLAVSKRAAELKLLGNKAALFRPVLRNYTQSLTNILMMISTSALVISYALYSFLGMFPMMILSLPFALYTIFRFLFLLEKKPEIPMSAYKIYKDKGMIIGILLWVASVAVVIYLV
jgi:4-hydroxybenzoate polyprenyltransferase